MHLPWSEPSVTSDVITEPGLVSSTAFQQVVDADLGIPYVEGES
jgi:hypothetical protein